MMSFTFWPTLAKNKAIDSGRAVETVEGANNALKESMRCSAQTRTLGFVASKFDAMYDLCFNALAWCYHPRYQQLSIGDWAFRGNVASPATRPFDSPVDAG